MVKYLKSLVLIIVVISTSSAQCYKSISVGANHTLGVSQQNELIGWGINNAYSLGNSSTTPISINTPIVINGTNTWINTWCYGLNTFALKNDNTLWGCGANNLGSLGVGVSGNVQQLTLITSGAVWTKITGSAVHSVGLRSDGTIWGCGENNNGRIGLGFGAPAQVLTFTQIGTANHWIDVTVSGTATFALRNDGTIWGTGGSLTMFLGTGADPSNTLRQGFYLGDNGITPIDGLVKVKSSRDFILGQKADGTLVAWGGNEYGELAMPLTYPGGSRPRPVGTDTWLDFAAGNNHALAIKTNGTLWAWGRNHFGQLGLGHTDNVSTPTQVGTANDWEKVYAAGNGTSLGVKTDGSIWVWGRNDYGQFGNGTTTQSNVPLQNSAICLQTLSTPSYTKPTLSIAPNPAKEMLYINYTNTLQANINIYDLQGRVVYQSSVIGFEGQVTILVGQWQQGVYLVQIQNHDGGSVVEKVLVN